MFSAKRDSCYHWYYKLASCWVLVKMQWTSIHKNKQQLPDSLSKYLFLLIFLLERGYKESFIVFQKGLCPEETLYVNFFFFFFVMGRIIGMEYWDETDSLLLFHFTCFLVLWILPQKLFPALLPILPCHASLSQSTSVSTVLLGRTACLIHWSKSQRFLKSRETTFKTLNSVISFKYFHSRVPLR